MILACQKLLGQITKVLGFGETPPLYGKNSQKIPYFFSYRLPKSLFYFDFFVICVVTIISKISRSTLRCFFLLRDSNIFTLRSDCCFVFVAESNTKGQQLGLRRRLPCFSSSSSPSPCQGPASAELDPFAGICSRPILIGAFRKDSAKPWTMWEGFFHRIDVWRLNEFSENLELDPRLYYY